MGSSNSTSDKVNSKSIFERIGIRTTTYTYPDEYKDGSSTASSLSSFTGEKSDDSTSLIAPSSTDEKNNQRSKPASTDSSNSA